MRPSFSRLLAMLALVLNTLSAQAVEWVVAGHEMKAMMQPFLPYRLAFGEWKIELTHPEPSFQPKGQQIALAFQMHLTQDVKSQQPETAPELQAKTRIGGELFYDKKRGQLQLVQPTLQDFQVIEGDEETFAPLISQLKQNLGQQIPIIVLVDARNLGPASLLTPNAITVVQNGVAIDF